MASEDPANSSEAWARALALLEATHQFPCDYSVTVIAFNRETVTESIKRTAVDFTCEPVTDVAPQVLVAGYEARASREGKYLSHRFAVPVRDAAAVLELYARLRALDGVVTIL